MYWSQIRSCFVTCAGANRPLVAFRIVPKVSPNLFWAMRAGVEGQRLSETSIPRFSR